MIFRKICAILLLTALPPVLDANIYLRAFFQGQIELELSLVAGRGVVPGFNGLLEEGPFVFGGCPFCHLLNRWRMVSAEPYRGNSATGETQASPERQRVMRLGKLVSLVCEGLKLGKAPSRASVQARGNCPVLQDCTSCGAAVAPYRPNEGEEIAGGIEALCWRKQAPNGPAGGRELVCLHHPSLQKRWKQRANPKHSHPRRRDRTRERERECCLHKGTIE